MEQRKEVATAATWGVHELAQFLGLSVRTIQDRLSRAPHTLPPRIRKTLEREPARWYPPHVVSWYTEGEAAQPLCGTVAVRVKTGRGRPRKVALRAAGDAA